MLVLTRKLRESVCIGDDIKVVVLGIDRNQIRLGIDAPGSVGIWRSEIKKGKPPEDENRGNR